VLTSSLFFLLLGCLSSWLVIQLCLKGGMGKSPSALIPQHHHTHEGIIPRIGGLGIIFGFALTYLLCFLMLDEGDNRSLTHYAIFAGGLASFLLGWVDDVHPLGAKLKLAGQILIACFAYACGLTIDRVGIPFTDIALELGILGFGLTVIWIVAIMNLINLIDGLDGLAGGIGLMLMVLLAFLAYQANVTISLILSLGMTGALVGFLFHNFPPAKVYLGDSGAYLVGFVIAALSLLNYEKGTILAALIAPVLALALPIADVGYAILRRALRGLPLFRADREHIHHRLLRAGFSHRKTVLILYAISLFALVVGLFAFAFEGRYLPIFLGFAFVLILITLRGHKIRPETVRDNLVDTVRSRHDIRYAVSLRDWFIIEAERADIGIHLWSDYRFVLKKIGFCRAELTIGEEQRSFFLPNTRHDDTSALHHFTHSLGTGTKLHLYADKADFSFTHFIIIADVAAEAWSKAAVRWHEVNGTPLTFDAKAREAQDYEAQKVRSLYRPTY
jgi:UDP-GlcNAc:undecaprenyl-phosphate GlcNAc-1-phosphate transferase